MTSSSENFVIFSVEENSFLQLLNSFSLGQKWTSRKDDCLSIEEIFQRWNWSIKRDEFGNLTNPTYFGNLPGEDGRLIEFAMFHMKRKCKVIVEKPDGSESIWIGWGR